LRSKLADKRLPAPINICAAPFGDVQMRAGYSWKKRCQVMADRDFAGRAILG
jgi:hypothetical protein